MTNPILEELKGWQGAIGACFGFLALGAGALLNFHLNRRRDARLRHEDALTVAAALYGEIVLLREEAAQLAGAVANAHAGKGVEIDAHFLQAHTLSEPMLYKALAAKVGLLSADLVLAITEFYKNIQQARTWLPLMVDSPERKYSYSASAVLIPARDAVTKIVPAMRKIEALANVSDPVAEVLEMGSTNDILDMDDEFWNTP